MKTKIFYFVVMVTLVSLCGQKSFSQTKRAMFLHGYSSSPTTGWTDVPRLDADVKNVPQTWINEGIINDYTVPNFGTIVDENTYLKIILDAMKAKDPQNNSRWLMIGHSLGGLGARAAEPYVKNGYTIPYVAVYPPRNLKGIITLGTPHQGAPVAWQVVYNEPYVISEVSRIRTAIEDGPDWQSSWGWAGIFIPLNFGFVQDLIYSAASSYYYKDFSNALNDGYTRTKEYIQEASANQAYKLAPNSSFLNEINAIPPSVPHISISGVETSPAFMRFIATIDDLGADKFSNEVDAVNTLNQMIQTYQGLENYHYSYTDDWYDYANYPTWLFHHEGMIYWRHGREALQGLDTKWAELHNATLSTHHQGCYQIWIYCGNDPIDPSVVFDKIRNNYRAT